MSVYTRVERDELIEFLGQYQVGTLHEFEGIQAGIENTNYFVDTSAGRWVLTLFEQHSALELPFFLNLMHHLHAAGIPSAAPQPTSTGLFLTELNGKPAALVERLQGGSVMAPEVVHCQAIGEQLGRMHVAGADFAELRPNCRDLVWMQTAAERLLDKLPRESAECLREELLAQQTIQASLPQGVIHADLFRDNALFSGAQPSGIIDFYYACTDVYLYDIAVCVNDWCSLADGTLDEERSSALLAAYQQQRALTAEELQAWPMMLRRAALRFWLSRLIDWHFPKAGEMIHQKDPEEFRMKLSHRQAGR